MKINKLDPMIFEKIKQLNSLKTEVNDSVTARVMYIAQQIANVYNVEFTPDPDMYHPTIYDGDDDVMMPMIFPNHFIDFRIDYYGVDYDLINHFPKKWLVDDFEEELVALVAAAKPRISSNEKFLKEIKSKLSEKEFDFLINNTELLDGYALAQDHTSNDS